MINCVECSTAGKREKLQQCDDERERKAWLRKEPLLDVAVEQVERQRANCAKHKAPSRREAR